MDDSLKIAARRARYVSEVSSVLIADTPQHGAALARLLQDQGCVPTVVHNPGQFRSVAALQRFDFVITELILPQQTGFELCHFVKSHWPQTPVLIVTEVDLMSSRNLAIWAGADGYVTKPILADDFYWLVRDVAEAVRDTQATLPAQLAGTVEFPCRCGASLRVKMENAGRRTVCQRCQQLILIPTLRQNSHAVALRPDGRPGDRERVGFYCRNCGAWLHLLQHQGGDQIVCQRCRDSTPIPDWIARRRRFFVSHDAGRPDAGSRIPFNPARYVTVRCRKCSTYYPLCTDDIDRVQRCSSCGECGLVPSVEGAPLSRAALASTGRLFAFLNPESANRIFLLPRRGHVKAGSADESGLRLREPGVLPRHARLKATPQGPLVSRLDPKGVILVNDEVLAETATLRPGDVLTLGSVRLLLAGYRHLTEKAVFGRVRDESVSGGTRSLTLEDRITRQAARILQLHWQLQQEQERSRENVTSDAHRL